MENPVAKKNRNSVVKFWTKILTYLLIKFLTSSSLREYCSSFRKFMSISAGIGHSWSGRRVFRLVPEYFFKARTQGTNNPLCALKILLITITEIWRNSFFNWFNECFLYSSETGRCKEKKQIFSLMHKMAFIFYTVVKTFLHLYF